MKRPFKEVPIAIGSTKAYKNPGAELYSADAGSSMLPLKRHNFQVKKLFLTICLFALAGSTYGQTYMTRTGKIYFDATTKASPEKIEGKNNEVATIIDAKTGDVRFQVLIKSFKFERESMQEHFNENYMESDKFPKSEFKGTIANLSQVNFSADGTYNATVSGKLTIHGVTIDVSVPGTIAVKGPNLKVNAKFPVKLKDVNITIPAVVADKVDKVVSISLDCDLSKK